MRNSERTRAAPGHTGLGDGTEAPAEWAPQPHRVGTPTPPSGHPNPTEWACKGFTHRESNCPFALISG